MKQVFISIKHKPYKRQVNVWCNVGGGCASKPFVIAYLTPGQISSRVRAQFKGRLTQVSGRFTESAQNEEDRP